MRKDFAFYFLQIVLLSVIYFFTARFGLSFDAVSGFATLVWIPSGISLVALVLYGMKLWPGIFLGAFLVNFFHGAPFLAAFGIGIGNTLEALIAAYILLRLGFNKYFERLIDVIHFVIIAAPIGSFVSATFGVASLSFAGLIDLSRAISTWRAWWIGDIISILVLSPFLLIWSKPPRIHFSLIKIVEFLLLFITAAFISFLVFGDVSGVIGAGSPVTFLFFPPLLWASLRFGQRGAVTLIFLLALISIISTIDGRGPFSGNQLSQRLLVLQGFMSVTAVTCLILASSNSERISFDQRKDEFISLASHELKTPLTTFKTYIHLLEKTLMHNNDKKSLVFLRKMNNQVAKLNDLINDLLDISKIYTGNLKINKEKISLIKLIDETVEQIQPSELTHKMVVKYPNKKDGFEVYVDKERIRQVLTNLIDNAVKYSPNAGKVKISLNLLKGQVVTSIRDYGVGIPESDQKKLFQRYYRAAQNDKNHFPGLGIGLYISQQIIKQHEGRMWVESKLNKGSTFYFSLPALSVKNTYTRRLKFAKI